MVKFEVKVVGHPKPEVKWSKAGEEILQSEEFQIENLEDGTSILIINDVYPDDTGEIKFEAFNSVGVAETFTEFIVEGKITETRTERVDFLFYFKQFEAFSAILRKMICSNLPLPLFSHTLCSDIIFH